MRRTFALSLIGLTIAASANAQPRLPEEPAHGSSRAIDPRAVVLRVRELITQRYVLPERRPALNAVLAAGLSSRRYNVREPAALASLINADLERVGRDRHLLFRYDPEWAARLAAQQSETAPDNSAFEQEARAANHGVAELRLLPGNIRYMAYNGAIWTGPESSAALEHAMRFLAGGDAIIIDIRRNGGGSAEPSRYLLSHFLPADQPLYTVYEDGASEGTSVSTLANVPVGRLLGKPLYVLTSGFTASAAEEFAGNVAGYRIGQVVGQRTSGAGFMTDLVPIEGRFVLSVSTARVVLASTGQGWEAVGIAPTIPVPVEEALDAAHAHALRRLGSAAQGSDRVRFEALAEGLEARFRPRQPNAPLQAYAGTFGRRVISFEDNRLYYVLAGVPKRQLLPLGGDRFTLDGEPIMRITFHAANGIVSSFEVGPATGVAQGPYERTQ